VVVKQVMYPVKSFSGSLSLSLSLSLSFSLSLERVENFPRHYEVRVQGASRG